MNIEKIEIKPNQYVWVDKDAEIKEGNWYYDDLRKTYWRETENPKVVAEYYFKIIAASPELNLEKVPTCVEWLANETYPETYYSGIYVDNWLKAGFIKGYQTAEKELPTWDDVRKAIELAQTVKDYGNYKPYTEEEIIEQLKQDKKL